jgi:hypothetical protein
MPSVFTLEGLRGDPKPTSNVTLWVAVALLSAGVVGATIYARYRK